MSRRPASPHPPDSAGPGSSWLDRLAQLAALGAIGILGGLLLLLDVPAGDTPDESLAAPQLPSCVGENRGSITGKLYGAIETELSTGDPGLRCGALPRPDDAGTRLFFAPGDKQLLVVIGLGAMPASALNQEVPANVTIVDEHRGQFYSSGNSERCWARIDQVESRSGEATAWPVGGTLFCTGALPALNGDGAVTLGELDFYAPFVATES